MLDAWRRSGDPLPVFARRHGVRSKRIKYWAGRLARAEKEGPTLTLVPGTVVGAELVAVIRAGEVTIELSHATPDQVTTIAQALVRPRL